MDRSQLLKDLHTYSKKRSSISNENETELESLLEKYLLLSIFVLPLFITGDIKL